MEQKLRKLIKDAMINKKEEKTIENESRYQSLKNILENAQKSAKDKKLSIITDTLIIDAAKKEIKQLNDLMEYVSPDDSKRLVEINTGIEAAKELLPKMATEDEIKAVVEANKEKVTNIGAMMKLLKFKFGDSLDGKMASQIVKEYL